MPMRASLRPPLPRPWKNPAIGAEGRASLPRAWKDRDIGAERLRDIARRGVVVGEIVDQLLGPDRGRLRQDIPVQRGADEGIGGGVDIDREGRDRLLADQLERILRDRSELVAADIMIAARDVGFL